MLHSGKITIGEQEQLLLLLAFHLKYYEICTPRHGTQSSLRVILGTLRIHYSMSDQFYGEGEEGFQQWLQTLWPVALAA
jgi:hypothetical protein